MRCTRPPGRWPSAATHCSRPPSRPCDRSSSAPGASARSPPPPWSCSTTSMAAPHDQQDAQTATGNGSMATSAQLRALVNDFADPLGWRVVLVPTLGDQLLAPLVVL